MIVSWFFLKALGEVLAKHVPTLDRELQAPPARRRRTTDASATVTIPAGTVLEVHPTLRKGGITEVLWEGECFCTPLDDLLGAAHAMT
jgi:hypothetical protein